MRIQHVDCRFQVVQEPGQPRGSTLIKIVIWKEGERIPQITQVPDGWDATIVPTAKWDEIVLTPREPLVPIPDQQDPLVLGELDFPRKDNSGWNWAAYNEKEERLPQEGGIIGGVSQ
jgi:hypothetical protein